VRARRRDFLLHSGGGTSTTHRIEVHLLVTYAVSAGGGNYDNTAVWLRERLFDSSPSTETIYTDTATTTTAVGYLYAYFLKTRMLPSSPDDPGVPVMVCVWTSDDQQLHINQVFPDPADPGNTGTIVLGSAATVFRRAVAHQGRVVLGEYINYAHGDDAAVSTDENVLWTDTNDNTLVTSTPAVFVPEVDHSISDLSSMSANQLLVVKRIGGGGCAGWRRPRARHTPR